MPELAKGYGLLFEDDARTIERALDRLIAAYPGETLRLLEVGIDQGQTARGIKAWLDARGQPFEYWGVESGRTGRAVEPFAGANIIVGDSTEVWHHVPGEMHFAFIDACHCDNHVILDFFNYGPKVRVGGLLLFHDTTPHTSFRDYQLHGPHIQEFFINCRHALRRIGLIQGRFPGWTLIEDTWPDGIDCGGVCVFRKDADLLAEDAREGREEVQLRADQEHVDTRTRAANPHPDALEETPTFAAPATPSGKHRLHVVTAVSRPKNLPRLFESLSVARARDRFDLSWHLVLDTNAVTPTQGLFYYLEALPQAFLYRCSEVSKGNRGGPQKNAVLDAIPENDEGLVWFLDDDTVCHPGYLETLASALDRSPEAVGVIVSQANADGSLRLSARPHNVSEGSIDTAQFAVRRSFIGFERLDPYPGEDGRFIQGLYRKDPDRFAFEDACLCYYNYLRTEERERAAEAIDFDALLPAHLGGHEGITHTDEAVLDWLVRRFAPKSFLDLGCGPGGMVEIAKRHGLHAVGMDGDLFVVPSLLHDFATGPFPAERLALLQSCLVPPVLLWCVEFVEHLEERYLPNLLPVLSLGDVAFLTHAVPGQGGYHHVNERVADYWQGVLAMAGCRFEPEATTACRVVATDHYTRATGMVFTRQAE